MITTIDGDGCWNPEWMKNVQDIIQMFPKIKFTASLITCYYEGIMRADLKDENIALAQKLFRMPNVEPASHSFSHPMDWSITDGKNLLDCPWNVYDEVLRSKAIINLLSPENRPCNLFLLTGASNPTVSQLKVLADSNMKAFNGGELTEFSRTVGEYAIYNQRSRADVWYTGIRKWDGARAYLDNPSGYIKAIDDFKERRGNIVHVYFHFYAGEFQETKDAIIKVLEWCESRFLNSRFLSDYITTHSLSAESKRQ